MNVPLGLAIGNANEVRERSRSWPAEDRRMSVELTVELAREMARTAPEHPTTDVEGALKDGQARWTPGAR
jgi:thymidine phosphorylase